MTDLVQAWDGLRCATCHRPVLRLANGTVEHGYLPPSVAPHEPVAEECDELDVIPVCDFCMEDLAIAERWVIPGESFVYDPGIAGFPRYTSKGDSAACTACKDDLLAQRWRAIYERYAATSGMAPKDPLMARLAEQWSDGFHMVLYRNMRRLKKSPWLERAAVFTEDGQHRGY